MLCEGVPHPGWQAKQVKAKAVTNTETQEGMGELCTPQDLKLSSTFGLVLNANKSTREGFIGVYKEAV